MTLRRALLGLLAITTLCLVSQVGEAAQTKDERRKVLDEIELLEIELLRAEDDLHAASLRIREREAKLAELSIRLDDAEARLAERRERMSLRLRAMYRFRHRGFLPLLFSASTPHELLQSARYLWWIVRDDQTAVENWQEEMDAVEVLRRRVEEERQDLLRTAGETSLRRAEQLRQRDERQRSLGRYRSPMDRRRMQTIVVEEPAARVDVRIDLRSEEPPEELPSEEVERPSTFARSLGRLPLPAVGPVARSGRGVDISVAAGTAIRAVHDGRVERVVKISGFGLVAIVDHGDGWHTVYAHAESFVVRPGQDVASGTSIGKVGDNGSLDGPLLHFEVRRDRQAEDPFVWLAIPPGVRVTGR